MKRRPPGGPDAPPRAAPVQSELFGPLPDPPRAPPPVPAPAVVANEPGPPAASEAAPAQEPAATPVPPAPVVVAVAGHGPLVASAAMAAAAPATVAAPAVVAVAVATPVVPPAPEPAPAAPLVAVAPVVAPAPAPAAPPVAVAPVAAPAPARRDYPWRAQSPAVVEPEGKARRVLSVGELTRQLKDTLERGFPKVCVRGEVSGYRGPNPRGHLYFTLKDADACLDAKVWASTASRLKFKLREGMEIIAEGSIDLYEPQGRYSLIVQRIEPSGEGALALAFQQLKEKLAEEGLFGDKRLRPPRPIPFLPRRIGVVTSRTGAALQDFLRVLYGRHPRLSVLLCDSRVQGDGAALEVVSAIQRLSRTDVDVIVVTRGGGSIEDLWTFNEELVARAIHACPVPVVSAIGHEVDFTIADFVADYRAPTPSAAAERLAPVLRDLELSLATLEGRLCKAVERVVLEERQHLRQLDARLPDPQRLLAQRRLQLSDQEDRLERAKRQALRQRREQLKALLDRLNRQRPQARLVEQRDVLARLKARLFAAGRELLRRRREGIGRARISLERASPLSEIHRRRGALADLRSRLVERQRRLLEAERRRFAEQVATLQALSPLNVMTRGYSVTFRRADGHLVRRAADVRVGDAIAVRLLANGGLTLADCEEVDATVTAVRGGREGGESR